jgi:hypothetical protein
MSEVFDIIIFRNKLIYIHVYMYTCPRVCVTRRVILKKKILPIKNNKRDIYRATAGMRDPHSRDSLRSQQTTLLGQKRNHRHGAFSSNTKC